MIYVNRLPYCYQNKLNYYLSTVSPLSPFVFDPLLPCFIHFSPILPRYKTRLFPSYYFGNCLILPHYLPLYYQTIIRYYHVITEV